MDNYIVVGIEKVDYTNKQGKQVRGTKLHCTIERKNTEGLAVETVYVSDDVCPAISLGAVIDVLYNKYGGVKYVSIVG